MPSLPFDVECRLKCLRERCSVDPVFQKAIEIASVERQFRSLEQWIGRNKKFPSSRCSPTLHEFLLQLKTARCVRPEQYEACMQEWTRLSHEDEGWLALESATSATIHGTVAPVEALASASAFSTLASSALSSGLASASPRPWLGP